MFENKKLLITGGTGTFGNAVHRLRRLRRWRDNGAKVMFENKRLLITGGTGSFGNAVLNRFLNTEVCEIRIFSRDEKKQDD